MSSGRFIAVDWGTTNRRVFLIEDGVVLRTQRDGLGASSVARENYVEAVRAIRAEFGDHPMLLAGMVGSTIGWQAVPYVPAPAGLAEVAAGLFWVTPQTAIVPGLSCIEAERADVMRGEEVQLLGAAAAGMAPGSGLLCQPGTHCKWARLEDGKIRSFVTAMSGELFALLRSHGLLAAQLTHPVVQGAAFRAGVLEGARSDLAASLFGIRARSVLGRADDIDASSFASGLLIGSDVAARMGQGEAVSILADPELGGLYRDAVQSLGGVATLVDSHAAFVAGISLLWRLAA